MLTSNWINFLSMLAQISVAFLAILFISFQIHRDRWVKRITRNYIAIQTLLEFLTPSFFAIIALLPTKNIFFDKKIFYVWQVGGVVLSICGLIVSLIIIIYGFKNHSSIGNFYRKQLYLQPIAFSEYVIILVFSLLGNLIVVSIMMILLLISGVSESWMFFVELDDVSFPKSRKVFHKKRYLKR